MCHPSSYQSADLTNLAAGNVKRGVTVAGVTGNFPSATSRLPRYSDSGATTTEAGTDETDLTLFATQLKSAGTFEYWDSSGIRLTGSGDADITAANVKDAVIFENLSVTGTYTGTAPNVWDVRAGVSVGGITGKLKVNCRNSVNKTYFNYDGVVGSLPNTGIATNSTNYDYWDTIDDYYGSTGSGFPGTWSVLNNYCGGIAADATDDNVWLDVTTGGCSAAKCRYKDKISGLEWSETATATYNWSAAINYCTSTIGTSGTYDGVTGWRLPTQKEMEAAYTHGITSAARADGYWTTLAQMQAYHWSSSTTANTTTGAWRVDLASGFAFTNVKTSTFQVACVK